MQCLPISLYRSPMAGTKLADLSLQITPCKEDEKKVIDFYEWKAWSKENMKVSSSGVWLYQQCSNLRIWPAKSCIAHSASSSSLALSGETKYSKVCSSQASYKEARTTFKSKFCLQRRKKHLDRKIRGERSETNSFKSSELVLNTLSNKVSWLSYRSLQFFLSKLLISTSSRRNL